MNGTLNIGDVVTFCNTVENYRHNALIVAFAENGSLHLVHVIEREYNNTPQVELDVPWTWADADGRYYVVEAKP